MQGDSWPIEQLTNSRITDRDYVIGQQTNETKQQDKQSSSFPSHSYRPPEPQHRLGCDGKQADSSTNYSPRPCDSGPHATACLDGDDLLAAHEEIVFANAGLSSSDIDSLRQRRKRTEEIAVCQMLLNGWHARHGMEIDASSMSAEELGERRRIVLCYASALEGLQRRQAAVDALRLGLNVAEEEFGLGVEEEFAPEELDVQLTLALAKLYFKDNRKEKAMWWLHTLLTQLRGSTDSNPGTSVPAEDASDVFHLAGWVRIHDDDHTSAYELWTEGYGAVPECASLGRQFQKRDCWDRPLPDDVHVAREIAGEEVKGTSLHDLEGFPARIGTPALALFDPLTQQSNLVFRSRHPILTAVECANVLRTVEEFHQVHRNGAWDTVRHSSVKTTDVAVEDIPQLRPWLRELLRTRLYPLVHAAYPKLADGSSTMETDATDETTCGSRSRVRVHDAFIVRYDADNDKSVSLPEHSDTSAVSFTVALNSSAAGDFEGGGTWFEALGKDRRGKVVDAEMGHAVAFAGPLRHAGYPVTKGVRIILVLFLYIEGFSYGRFLEDYTKKHESDSHCLVDRFEKDADGETKDSKCSNDEEATHVNTRRKPSGDMPGGFVVYNQTVELVEMLNRRVDSVLDCE